MYKKITFQEVLEHCEYICNCDCSKPVNSEEFHEILALVNSSVMDFFDHRGSREMIVSIYEKLKNNELPYNKVETIDVYKVVATYKDYLSSMDDYIVKILDTSSEAANYGDYINKAIQNDHEYVCKLMHDTVDKYTLDEAMSNIEYLINIKEDIEGYTARYDEISNKGTELAKLCAKMYGTSVTNFVKHILSSIYSCYEAITVSVTHRDSAVPQKPIDKRLL